MNTYKENSSLTREILSKYRKYASNRCLFLIISASFLLLFAVWSLTVGAADIPISKAISALLGSEAGPVHNIMWRIRVPRVIAAVAAGVGLSVAGAALQSVLRNPLGSPYTLGISHAAAFGAAFAIIVLGAGSTQSTGADAVILNNAYLVSISAFLWSLVSIFTILLLARWKKATPATMILAGVAMGSLFTAGYTVMQYFADTTQLASIVFWTFGDVGRATWRDVGLILGVVVPSTAYFMYKSWDFEVLDSGDQTAESLGVNVKRLRLQGMLISGFITALIVSMVGIIGFVGLVVPHIVRRLIGGNERFLIPTSCVFGGILLLVSDAGARTLIAPTVLPVGILTSFLGAPLFIYLVIKGREYW